MYPPFGIGTVQACFSLQIERLREEGHRKVKEQEELLRQEFLHKGGSRRGEWQVLLKDKSNRGDLATRVMYHSVAKQRRGLAYLLSSDVQDEEDGDEEITPTLKAGSQPQLLKFFSCLAHDLLLLFHR